MNDYKNFHEYAVKPLHKPGITILKFILLALYTLLTAAYLFIFWLVFRQWQLLLLLPFILYALIALTWRFVNVEYEYAIAAGALSVSHIYGGRSRRLKLTVEINEMTLIAPLSDQTKRLLDAPDVIGMTDYSKEPGSLDTMIAVYPDKRSGKKRVLLFEADDEMRRILKLFNHTAYSA